MLCGLLMAAAVPRVPAPISGAEAYYTYVQSCLDGLEHQLPVITASAEAAAERYVKRDEYLSQMGERAFSFDRGYRGGNVGFMSSMVETDIEDTYRKIGIVLVAPREENFAYDLDRLRVLHHDGKLIIAFGRPALLSKFKLLGAHFDYTIDPGALPRQGLLRQGNQWLVPTEPTAHIAVYWVWIAEFYSACTRLGKQPVMSMYYEMPDAAAWRKKYSGVRFHNEVPTPIPAGTLATQYLTAVRGLLQTLHDKEMPAIRATATRANEVRARGGKLYMIFMGYNRWFPCDEPGDPRFFTNYLNIWREEAALQPGDLAVVFSIDQVYQGEYWGNAAEKARAAQVQLVWCMSPRNPEQVAALPAGETVLNQHCPPGDAVIDIPGYPLDILSGSAIVSETTRWMINAEMLRPLVVEGSAR